MPAFVRAGREARRRRRSLAPGALLLLLAACSAPDVRFDLVRIPAHGSQPSFLISRCEITNAQYAAFVSATGYDGTEQPSSKPDEPFLREWVDGAPPPRRELHPVCSVNVHHARAYCAWASAVTGQTVRLPADAEWEFAARGAEARSYPWGELWDPRRCNWGDALGADRFGAVDGFEASAPVGSFPEGATPEGVLDLAGNIWEWTAEGHLRGGPWCLGPEALVCATIAAEDTGRADDKFGFRVVVEP